MQIYFLCPARISRFVQEPPFECGLLVHVCFLLNKAFRERPFSVCVDDTLCSVPVCVNPRESACD